MGICSVWGGDKWKGNPALELAVGTGRSLSEVLRAVVVVCWEAKRDQVGFRRGQRQENGVQLSWSKLALLTAAVNQPRDWPSFQIHLGDAGQCLSNETGLRLSLGLLNSWQTLRTEKIPETPSPLREMKPSCLPRPHPTALLLPTCSGCHCGCTKCRTSCLSPALQSQSQTGPDPWWGCSISHSQVLIPRTARLLHDPMSQQMSQQMSQPLQ